jgi:hypothetical protein
LVKGPTLGDPAGPNLVGARRFRQCACERTAIVAPGMWTSVGKPALSRRRSVGYIAGMNKNIGRKSMTNVVSRLA